MILRQAEKKDREHIIQLTANTWDGWDYIPLLLDQWFEEKGLFVAEKDHEVVAITKTTLLSPGELWLEGIRTRKELRGQGIGKALAFYQLEEALKQHPRVIRLSTAEVNTESINLIEKMGFSLLHTFSYLEYHNPRRRKTDFGVLPVKDTARPQEILSRSAFLGESRGLIPSSWIFRQATAQLLSSYSEQKQCFLYNGKGPASGILLLLPHRYNDRRIEIALIDAPGKQIEQELFQFAIHHAAMLQKEDITFFAPSERLEAAAKYSGFFFPYDFSKVLVYELIPS
jgi:GNAT superfamily N-acetyltransferase